MIISLSGCQSTATGDKASPVSQTKSSAGQDPADLIAKGQGLTDFACTVVMTTPDGNKTTSQMWTKGGNLRFETTNPADGQKFTTIVNQIDKVMYLCQPEQKTAMKMPIDKSKMASGPQDQLSNLETSGLKYVKQETYAGKKCAVYQSGQGNTLETVWLWVDKGLPLRVEANEAGGKTVIEYTAYSFDKIDDSLFQVSGDWQVTDIMQMPNPQN
jgi:outer membrane lipoprotein-sorting protein